MTYRAKQYCCPVTPAEAYETLQKSRKHAILAGGIWLGMGHKEIHTLIDIHKLGLNQIQISEDRVQIGAMTTLRQLETDPGLTGLFGGAFTQCVQGIGGVQLRNMATIGGSVCARLGFSDVITVLLALDASLELYAGKSVPLETFLENAGVKDLLLEVQIPNNGGICACQQTRLNATDLPVLTVAAANSPSSGWRVAVGARPGIAKLAYGAMKLLNAGGDIPAACLCAAEELTFGSNGRGSADYRKELCKVLLARAIAQVKQRMLKGE